MFLNEKDNSSPTLFPTCLRSDSISIPKADRASIPPDSRFLRASLISNPEARKASGLNGVSSSGISPDICRTSLIFSRKEPLSIVSFSGSTILYSVNLLDAVS